MKAKLINACKNTWRSKDERHNRNAIYFIIIETTLQDNEVPVGVGYFILIKSGAVMVCFHTAMGRNLLEMMSVQQSIALVVALGLGAAKLGGLGCGSLCGEGIFAVGEK